MATCCCCPPDSCAGSALTLSPMPSWPSNSAAFATASCRGRPATSSGTAAFSAAVSAGSRLYCWKTKPMFLPRKLTFCPFRIRVRSCPSTDTAPRVGSSSPATTEISVVLPQPLGPTSSVISPAYTSRSTPRSACTFESPSPNSFVTPRHSTARDFGVSSTEYRSPRTSSSVAVMFSLRARYRVRFLFPKHPVQLHHHHAAGAHEAPQPTDDPHRPAP